MSIGILAYGSLLEEPGNKLEKVIVDRIKDVVTPFKIEFARKSSTRDDAPTLIPYNKGSKVKAQILVLEDSVSIKDAKSMLYRREARSNKEYKESKNPSNNKVIVKVLKSFYSIDYVLYTKIGSNLESITPEILAKLAIKSAKSKAGEKRKDGISYLIDVKKFNVKTPLMEEYENKILEICEANL
jgi:hypothetical protein